MDKTAIENMTLDQLKELEAELKGQVPSDVVELKRVQDRINFEEQAEEVRKLNQEQEAAQQVRIQAQEEKVDSITLPYDFNDLFSDDEYKNAQGQPHKVTVANSMIIELIKDLQRKAYEDHNEEMRARDERELQLKRQNESLQERLSQENAQAIKDAEELTRLEAQLAQLQLDKQDSDSKRDAAVKQFEEAQAEITQLKGWNDDLRAQAAVGVRKAIDVVDISPTDKLAQMVKETNEQKANRALARWNTIMPEVVAPPIAPEVSTFQPGDTQTSDYIAHLEQTASEPIPAVGQVNSFRPEDVQTVSVPLDGNTTVPKGDAETVTRSEFEALKAIVKECAHVCDVDIAQVA